MGWAVMVTGTGAAWVGSRSCPSARRLKTARAQTEAPNTRPGACRRHEKFPIMITPFSETRIVVGTPEDSSAYGEIAGGRRLPRRTNLLEFVSAVLVIIILSTAITAHPPVGAT